MSGFNNGSVPADLCTASTAPIPQPAEDPFMVPVDGEQSTFWRTFCSQESEDQAQGDRKRKLACVSSDSFSGIDSTFSIAKIPKTLTAANVTTFISNLTKRDTYPRDQNWHQKQNLLRQQYCKQIEYYSNKERLSGFGIDNTKTMHEDHSWETDTPVLDNVHSFLSSLRMNYKLQPHRSSGSDSVSHSLNNILNSCCARAHPSSLSRSLWRVAYLTTPELGEAKIKKLNRESRFHLVQQPFDVQRKSYQQENRCIKPSPLILRPKQAEDEATDISDATVSVKLATEAGGEIGLPSEFPEALSNLDGSPLSSKLDITQKAKFYLKLAHTSGGRKMRLLFVIKYNVQQGDELQEERVYSEPFLIFSNKGKN